MHEPGHVTSGRGSVKGTMLGGARGPTIAVICAPKRFCLVGHEILSFTFVTHHGWTDKELGHLGNGPHGPSILANLTQLSLT